MPPDSANPTPELASEERARIYAEEKARLEIREQLKREKNKQGFTLGLGIAIFVGLIVLYAMAAVVFSPAGGACPVGAEIAARVAVRQELAPRRADFGTTVSEVQSTGRCLVMGRVSTIEVGSRLERDFMVVLRQNGGEWAATSVNFK